MAISPLDIYERAYRLQYDQNDNAGAIELYKRLISEFPDSNECGYAAVQLEKMQATGIIDDIERLQRRKGGAMALIALIVGIVALGAAAGVGAFIFVNHPREIEINSVLVRSLGALAAGQTDDALSQLGTLQRKYPSNADIRSLILTIQTRKPTAPAIMPPTTSASSDTSGETTEVTSEAAQKTEPRPAPAPAPPVLSHQQKVLSQQLLAKPAAQPRPAIKPQPVGARPTGGKKAADDSISFFP
jgi:hypothetical protein